MDYNPLNRMKSRDSNWVTDGVPANVKLRIQRNEREQRKSGRWVPFDKMDAGMFQFPEGSDPQGWLRDISEVYRNGWCVVLVRTCKTSWGIVKHAGIATALSSELTWPEKMKIKNAIFGPLAIAVEVFPDVPNVIDAANMWHLWILPDGMRLPFGLGAGDACSSAAEPGAKIEIKGLGPAPSAKAKLLGSAV